MQQRPAFGGWGRHEFDGAPVFLLNLPKNIEVYDHEFYIDTVGGEDLLHHRMIDTEADEPVFEYGFLEEDGDDILALLISKGSYWFGITDDDTSMEDVLTDDGGVDLSVNPNGSDSIFTQQHIPEAERETLLQIAYQLYA